MSRRSLLAGLAASPVSRLQGAETIAAGRAPSRIVLGCAGDPAHSQTLTWRAAHPLAAPRAEITRFSPDPSFAKSAKSFPASTVSVDRGDDGGATHYSVLFEGLEPNTQYCYRVGDDDAWSEWCAFRTAAAKHAPFRFLYVGDAQNSIRSLWSRSIRAAYAAAPDARFILHAGDLVNDGYDDRLRGEWCDALGPIGATVPNLPVPGNHDLHRAPGSQDSKTVMAAPEAWRRHFALPANGPNLPEMPSQSYFVDYQGVRFVALDANVFANENFDETTKERVMTAELDWLRRVLQKKGHSWTVVVQHQAIHSIAKGRNYAGMRELLAPIYEKHGVDLVLQGHDHAYARTHKVARGRVVDPAAPGPVYAISVSGPKMYEAHRENRQLMAKVIEHQQFFQTVSVLPDRLRYKAFSIDGTLKDAFELRAGTAGSRYVNLVPSA